MTHPDRCIQSPHNARHVSEAVIAAYLRDLAGPASGWRYRQASPATSQGRRPRADHGAPAELRTVTGGKPA